MPGVAVIDIPEEARSGVSAQDYAGTGADAGAALVPAVGGGSAGGAALLAYILPLSSALVGVVATLLEIIFSLTYNDAGEELAWGDGDDDVLEWS